MVLLRLSFEVVPAHMDEPAINENEEAYIRYWKEFDKAHMTTSICGEFCKFVGGVMPILMVLIGFAVSSAVFSTLDMTLAFAIWPFAFLLALAGAPIAALGTIATETKRQRRLLEFDIRHR